MRAALLPPSQALVLSLFCSTHCFLLPITLVHGGKRPKQASTSEHLRHYMHCTQKYTHTTHTRRHTTHTDSNVEEHGWNEKKSSFPFLKVCCLPRTWLGNRYPTPSAGGTRRCRRANQSEKGREGKKRVFFVLSLSFTAAKRNATHRLHTMCRHFLHRGLLPLG